MNRNPISRFFIWCSGSDPDILFSCPRAEQYKHFGYGTMVLVPALLGAISMTYALSTITDNSKLYEGLGITWGIIVFFLDRFILSSYRKKVSLERHQKETESDANDSSSPVKNRKRPSIDFVGFGMFFSRLVFAAFIGLMISHPLVLLYFDDSIQHQIDQKINQRQESSFEEYEVKIDRWRNRIEEAKSEIDARQNALANQQDIVEKEIDGIVTDKTTGFRGRGPSAKEKITYRDELKADLAKAQREFGETETEIKAKILDLEQERDSVIQSTSEARDYLAMEMALSELKDQDPIVGITELLIILFFILVDILPITVKYITRPGPYDHSLAALEAEFLSSSTEQRLAEEKMKNKLISALEKKGDTLIDEWSKTDGFDVQRILDKLSRLLGVEVKLSKGPFMDDEEEQKRTSIQAKQQIKRALISLGQVNIVLVLLTVAIAYSVFIITKGDITYSMVPVAFCGILQHLIESQFSQNNLSNEQP